MSANTIASAEELRFQARGIITQGRYPFRKITTDSALLTAGGYVTPDLVFWINRDSCIAGGCVFFCPEPQLLPELLQQAQACAEALALNQFATWSSNQIIIWQAETLEKRFELEPHSDIDGLTELLDQFKLLAVIEAKSNNELTSWHISNLCLQSVTQGTLSLSAYLRRKNLSDGESAAQQAHSKLILCVARMLTALHADTLPSQTKPEILDRTLKDLSDLHSGLKAEEPEVGLDKKSSILLHNLLRRLDQIDLFRGNRARACAMLEQLLSSTIHPSCKQQKSFDLPPSGISVYMPEVEPGTLEIEVDTGARLLFKNLARKLGNADTCITNQFEQLFSVPTPLPRTHCSACFFSSVKPDAARVDALNAHMRTAWPGRRINLTKSTPMGLWQFTYLLGILAEGESIYACLAPDLFQAVGCDKVLTLIHSCMTLAGAGYRPETGNVELLLRKSGPQDEATTFYTESKSEISWHALEDPIAAFYSALQLDSAQNASAPTPRISGNKQQNLRQQLIHELDSQGVPQFPTTYVFNIPAENLKKFHLDKGPWHICQTFMGLFSLCNKEQDQICEARAPHAYALVLASYLDIDVLLPANEGQCQEVLLQYLRDLNQTYLHIMQEAHVHLKTSAAAKRFANKFWKELNLPPWNICQEIASQLGLELHTPS
ncbi:MAG: hypothetical protein RBR43_08510 [Desulfuromonadaceae bacterium]|nr:hypothetical protein [Desulfuromonas sp.]MDY0185903.1 hypothetical protein [Desulfuromonadaceae bacterium]